jgi:hypothetical protein
MNDITTCNCFFAFGIEFSLIVYLIRVKRVLELEQQLMKEGGNPSNANLVENNKKLTEEMNELKMEKSRMTSQLEVQ